MLDPLDDIPQELKPSICAPQATHNMTLLQKNIDATYSRDESCPYDTGDAPFKKPAESNRG